MLRPHPAFRFSIIPPACPARPALPGWARRAIGAALAVSLLMVATSLLVGLGQTWALWRASASLTLPSVSIAHVELAAAQFGSPDWVTSDGGPIYLQLNSALAYIGGAGDGGAGDGGAPAWQADLVIHAESVGKLELQYLIEVPPGVSFVEVATDGSDHYYRLTQQPELVAELFAQPTEPASTELEPAAPNTEPLETEPLETEQLQAERLEAELLQSERLETEQLQGDLPDVPQTTQVDALRAEQTELPPSWLIAITPVLTAEILTPQETAVPSN